MSTALYKLFSPDDIKRIENAVKEAEKQTSGEIVPYAVHASDPYEHALWRAGVLFGIIALAAFGARHQFTSASWMPFELTEIGVGTLGTAVVGALLALYVTPLKRFFAGNDMMERRVKQRATEAFLAEEVFTTRERTGTLIFLSLLERKVVVLGDSGINAKVQQSEWDGIVKTIVDGMRANKPADALIEAVRQCGALLKKEGLPIEPDDKDELSNRMRTSES